MDFSGFMVLSFKLELDSNSNPEIPMKPSQALLGILAVSHSTVIQAANLTWDSNGTAVPNPNDGGGAWTAANLFWNGTANVTWPAGGAVTDTAVFGANPVTPYSGIPGAVSFTTAISAGGLTFQPYIGNVVKYNISGGTGGTLTLNGTPAIAVETNWVRPFAAINGILAGTAGFDVTSTTGGILEIGTQANTITGGIRLKSGSSLSIGGDNSFGGAGNGLSFDGDSTLITRTTTAAAATRTFTIANASLAKFDSLNGQTLTVQSAIGETGGAGRLQKEGLGGLTLNTGNTYTGSTGVRAGTLTLNFANVTAPAAPTSDIIAGSSPLRLLGGTLAVTGKAATANTQAFGGLTLLPGASGLSSTAGAGGSTAVNFGTISRIGGSTLNVATIAAGTSYTTSTGETNGILGGFGTVNNADWLSAPGGTFAAYAAYQTGTDATAWAATDNVSVGATPAVPLAGSATLNTVKFTGTADLAIPSGQTLTLTSGGVLVTAGTASISGGNLRGTAGFDLIVHQHNASNATTISSAIIDNTSATALTKNGGGTLVLSGTNLYTGNTYLNAGVLEFSSDSNLGGGFSVVSRPGTTVRIAGASAFTSSKNFQFDLGSDSYGGATLGAGPNSTGNFNINVTNTAGATISGQFNSSGGTMVKSGAGTLTLTNTGVNHLTRVNGGLSFTANNGTTIFDGGASSEWIAGQGEFVVGDRTTSEAVVRLDSGTISTGSWVAVGRGNGTTGLQSGLIVNGGTLHAANLFTGFSDGLAGYNARPYVQINNGATLNVADTLRIGESLGSNASLTISDTSTTRVNNSLQLGFLGKGTLNIEDSATIGIGQMWLGGNGDVGNTAAGVINQSGGSLTRQGILGTGTSGDWRIGGFVDADDLNSYGAYNISGGTLNTGNRNVQIGANGIGVMKVSGTAAVVMNDGGGFPVVGRFAGGSGLLDVSGGSFTQNAAGQLLIIGEAGTAHLNVSGTGSVVALGGAGGAGAGGGTGGIRTGHTGSGVSTITLNGGTVEASGIAKSNAAVTATSHLYLNGGLLKARTTNATFLQGHDAVVVGAGGAKIDTNGVSVTVGQALLRPDTSSGVTSIPILTGGAGYLGAPIVRISGGAGAGATAIATVSGGAVTGITITSPGTGYLGAPTVTLLGGGATTAATLGTITIGANAADGGLTKSGFGTLTLGGANTYTGTTAVTEDRLLVTGSVAGPVTVDAGCIIGGTGTLANTLTVDATGILAPGLSAGTLAAGNTVMPGTYQCEIDGANADRLTVTGDLNLTGSALEVTVLAGGATQSSYTIASYTGTLTGSLTPSGSLPATYSLFNDTVNKEIKLVSGGSYGSWQAGFGLNFATTGAPDADADGDGIDNAVEYVTGGDPTATSQAQLPTFSATGSNLVFTFSRTDSSETADVLTTVEVGTSLTSFPDIYTVGTTTGNSSAGVTVAENGAAPDTITVTIPKGTDVRKFARLNVTILP
jgi:autotransporter-associated beta strand protein